MASSDRNIPHTTNTNNAAAFHSAEEAWFWFIAAQGAKNDGARVTAGQGSLSRPCEPSDIFQVVNRLYRQRRLLMDHLLVLRHYGKRHMAPDPRRVKEARANLLWREALSRIEVVLERKGIVKKPHWLREHLKPAANWVEEAIIYERVEA